jgi:hypothetical protein
MAFVDTKWALVGSAASTGGRGAPTCIANERENDAGRGLAMNKTKLVTLLGALIFASSVAAHAQAIAPDPNLGLLASGEEALIPPTPADSPQLAAAADPNIGPSTSGEEALIPPTSPARPQLAVAPDPDVGEPGFREAPEMQAGGATVGM